MRERLGEGVSHAENIEVPVALGTARVEVDLEGWGVSVEGCECGGGDGRGEALGQDCAFMDLDPDDRNVCERGGCGEEKRLASWFDREAARCRG